MIWILSRCSLQSTRSKPHSKYHSKETCSVLFISLMFRLFSTHPLLIFVNSWLCVFSYDCGYFAILYWDNFDSVIMTSFDQVCCSGNQDALFVGSFWVARGMCFVENDSPFSLFLQTFTYYHFVFLYYFVLGIHHKPLQTHRSKCAKASQQHLGPCRVVEEVAGSIAGNEMVFELRQQGCCLVGWTGVLAGPVVFSLFCSYILTSSSNLNKTHRF